MNISNFIEEYKIPKNICDNFISYHKKNKEYKRKGTIKNDVMDLKEKDSTDVFFYNESKQDFIINFFKLLGTFVNHYMNKYEIEGLLHTAQSHKIQHYEKNKGYFKQHYEKFSLQEVNRELVYMLYCNDVKNGGTNFPFQNIKTECKKGNLIIWPAFFTHPHHGIISRNKEKYIVTGWFLVK